jgi:tetratricopeptide (TPR) repeat protein
MRTLATLVIVLAAATAADAKPKPKDTAKVHTDRAAKAHKDGKYDVALSELQAAYAIDPQPKLLFAIAQVQAKLDNCEAAIENYEKFNAATKDKSKQAVVQQAIDACKKKIAEQKAAQPDKPDPGVFRAKKPAEGEPIADAPAKVEAASEPPPVETKPVEPAPVETEPPPPPKQITAFDEPKPAVTTTVTPAPSHSPWYHDVIGDALVVAGLGAGVGSVIMYTGAKSELDKAEAATNLGDYKDHRDSAESKQLVTFVLAGSGIALVTAGVLHYALRSSHGEHRVAVVPTGDGGLITWSGGF